MADIRRGGEVRVLKHRSRYDKFPEDGYPGTVTRVGRKYATATYQVTTTGYDGRERQYEYVIEFDMATGYERGTTSGSGHGRYVRTPGQFEQDRRRAAARSLLRDHGIEFSSGHPVPTLEQLEQLAEVVRTWDQEDRP